MILKSQLELERCKPRGALPEPALARADTLPEPALARPSDTDPNEHSALLTLARTNTLPF